MTRVLIGIFILFSQTLIAQTTKDSLNIELEKIISNSKIPGLGVCVVGENGIVYSEGFGYRDVEQKKYYDSLTVQPVASISKTMIAVALMKLVEDGKVNLNEDINTYLPFKVTNPYFPEAKITLLQLATHTSSISENAQTDAGSYYIIEKDATKEIFPKGYYKAYKKYSKNEDIAIDDYLKNYLTTSGTKFKKKNFGKYKPGTEYTYSNIASTLAAYIIEVVSEQSFEDFTKVHIFEPLAMTNTSWKQANTSNVSSQYFHNGAKAPDYSLITFPAIDLHTNSIDMGKFLFEIMNGFNGSGTLLNKASYQQMFTNQINIEGTKERRGIFWSITPEGNIGHGGAEIGTACELIFSPQLDKGFFMIINMSVYGVNELEGDYVNILITISKYFKRL
ncbi:MAG: serine hydrolase domain-containing protein [Bacteroidota bacterium]